MARVLVHDLLMSKRGLSISNGPIKECILRHKTRLNAEFVKLKVKKGVKSYEELALKNPVSLPRWLRINTIKSTKDEVLQGLGLDKVSSIEELGPDKFYIDDCVENLIAIDPSFPIVENSLYKEGKVIIQDKASCFPAAVLAGLTGHVGDIIDGCAAPGNKTTHLAACFPKSHIFAFERDAKRVQTLRKMVGISGANNVTIEHQDFTLTDPKSDLYRNVTHILLDPSCSGSGIVSRQDYLLGNEQDVTEDTERLENLCSFQSTILKHALQFPNCRHVTYSTCSVHRLENEQVVCEVLSQEPDWKCNSLTKTLPNWKTRGIPEYCTQPSMAEGMIRCKPGAGGTIGFFVANLYHPQREQETFKMYKNDDDTKKRKRKKKKKEVKKKARIQGEE